MQQNKKQYLSSSQNRPPFLKVGISENPPQNLRTEKKAAPSRPLKDMCITVCSYKHRLQPELKFNVRIYLARPEAHRVCVGSDTLLLQTSIIHFAAGASCHCYARKKTHTHTTHASPASLHILKNWPRCARRFSGESISFMCPLSMTMIL